MKRKSLFALIALFAVAAFNCRMAFAEDGEGESTPTLYTPTILQFEDEDDIVQLENEGVIIWRRRADMLLALVPRNKESKVRKTPGLRMEMGKKNHLAMDIARPLYGGEKVISGQDLPRPYTGKGVVAGFFDIGFDPNHIAFLDEEGNSRVKLLVNYQEPYAIRTVVDTPEGIAEWTTDNANQYHGTHVANIIAGSYRDSGYYGMAPDADIVATTGMLYDVGILSACEDIIEYAHKVDKPAVINLSLSNYNGPHDGTTLFNRYMDLLGEEAIICLAAGNAGGYNVCKRIDFTEENTLWRTRYHSSDYTQFHVMGMTDAWSADDRPIGVKVMIYDEMTASVVYEGASGQGPDPYGIYITSDSDEDYAQFMTGYVWIYGRVDELSGRWVTEIYYDNQTEYPNTDQGSRWARYGIAFEFSAEPGVHADINTDGAYSLFLPLPGMSAPSSDLSISDLCTGRNVVSVGMYNSRNSCPLLGGGTVDQPVEPGTINHYSSYGTLIDGRVMPHTVAPGSVLISAVNSHFIEKYPDMVSDMSAKSTVDDKDYYWRQMGGTSMASPYTAGVIACWLEADPTLTIDRVHAVLNSTNLTTYPDPEDPRHGKGWLQPYEGMKLVLHNSMVSVGALDTAAPSLVVQGGAVDLLNPGCDNLRIRVLTLSGVDAMPMISTSERVATIDLSHLPKGVYLVCAEGLVSSARSVKVAI